MRGAGERKTTKRQGKSLLNCPDRVLAEGRAG